MPTPAVARGGSREPLSCFAFLAADITVDADALDFGFPEAKP
jgi:hypothetical protein